MSQAGERECQPATSVCTVKLLRLEDYLYRVPVKREVKAKSSNIGVQVTENVAFIIP